MAKKRDRPAAELLAELTASTLVYCARRYEQLRGLRWSEESAHDARAWMERSNRDERAAFTAFVALQKALVALRVYYRKHPAPGELPLQVRGARVVVSEAAFVDEDDDPLVDGSASSNHGGLLHMIRGNIEPLLGLPWAAEKRRALVWEDRMLVVSLYDREYRPEALHVRSPGATSTTRLTGTELAWHSILLLRKLPGLDLASGMYEPEDVVSREARDIADAQRRLRKLQRWAALRNSAVPSRDVDRNL